MSYDDYSYNQRQVEIAKAVMAPGIGPRGNGTSVEIHNSPTNVTFNLTFNVGTPTPEVMTSLEAIKNAIETDKAGFAELLLSSGVLAEVVQRSDCQRLQDERREPEPAQRRGIFGFLGRGT